MPVSETILPVLIGADMNGDTLARAFHEAYGVRSYAFGRWAMGCLLYTSHLSAAVLPQAGVGVLHCLRLDVKGQHTSRSACLLDTLDVYKRQWETREKCSGAKVGIPAKANGVLAVVSVSPMEKIPGSNTPMMSPA